MLSMLTIHANQRVSVDALSDAAWGEHVTPGAMSTLVSHVWRLRQLLEPGRTAGQAPSVLVSDAGGYRLIVDVDCVDSLVVGRLASEVRALLQAGHPAAALGKADEALGLWRGQPYGGLADLGWARPTVARLDELYGQLCERRVEALLATGDVEQALLELEPLIATMPFRESLRSHQMIALYRRGRVEEALQAYQRARRALVDEIGTEPGSELQELHRRILDNDPGLADSERIVAGRGPMAQPPIEVHLPGALTSLIGRDEVVGRVGALITEHRLVTIVGPAGCGKTRVAIEVARTNTNAFPDGVWFVDLSAVSDLSLVIDVITSTIGFISTDTTAVTALRSYLCSRRILLVLDNCEHVLPAVASIIETVLTEPVSAGPAGTPDIADCCVLATSREPIGVDGETVWTLEPLQLPVADVDAFPQAAPAVDLFLQRMLAVAPTLVVDEQVVESAVAICTALDGLPLPIELAAARARSYTLSDIAAQVADDPGRLARIGRGPDDHRATVRSAIEWSHRMLSEAEQITHRRIAVLPGHFTQAMASAAIGEVPGADVETLLAQLVHRSMLFSGGVRQTGGTTLFRQLATVRAHAQYALAESGETAGANDRRDAWTIALLASRPRLGQAAEIGWYRQLDDGYSTVRATLARHLIEQPSVAGARLAPRLARYWYYRARLVEGTRWLKLAFDQVKGGEPADVMLAEMALSAALLMQGQVDQARPHIEDALQYLPDVADHHVEDVIESLIGVGGAAWHPGAADIVIGVHRELARMVGRTPDVDLHVLTDALGCLASMADQRPEQAVGDAAGVYERAMAADNIMAGWISAAPPMIWAILTEDPVNGIPWVNRLMRSHLRLGAGGTGPYMESRANFAALTGDYQTAVRLHSAAFTETRRSGMVWPRREITRQFLQVSRGHLGESDYDHAWREGGRWSLADVVGLDALA